MPVPADIGDDDASRTVNGASRTVNGERAGCFHPTRFLIGSQGGTRTPDPVVNSHLLYRLSYLGSVPLSGAP